MNAQVHVLRESRLPASWQLSKVVEFTSEVVETHLKVVENGAEVVESEVKVVEKDPEVVEKFAISCVLNKARWEAG